MERLPRGLQVYVLAVIATASAVVWVAAATVAWDRWPEMLLFAVLITLVGMFPIPDPLGGYTTSTPTLLYVLLCVQNPQTALFVSAIGSSLGGVISQAWVPWRRLFNGAQWGLSVGLAGIVFHLLGGSLENPGILSLLVPLAVASLMLHAANTFFVAWFFSWIRKKRPLREWTARFRVFLWPNLLTVATAALLAILYVSVHPLTLLLFLVLVPALRWADQLYRQNQKIFGQAINSLVIAIDASFPEGRGHSRRVADLTVAVARQLGLADSVIDGIELGALVHDVGMIGLEELLLESHDRSDSAKLLEHVKSGAEVAAELPRRDIREIVLYHHEHFDGTGYMGLRGSQIPIGARIVALAEAVESLVSLGASKSDDTLDEEIITKIRQEAGKQFDPHVIDAFLEVARDDPDLLRARLDSLYSSPAAEPEPGS